MKAIIWWIIGAIVVVALGLGVYLLTKNESVTNVDDQSTQVSVENDTGGTISACEILTEDVARDILGEGATKTELPVNTDVASDDVSVSNCLYDNGSEDIDTLLTANVLVRAAKTDDGRDSNLFGFEGNKTLSPDNGGAPAEDISNLGDGAWYDPSLGQVNVLIDGGNYWLIISAGDQDKTLSEQLARAVVVNL